MQNEYRVLIEFQQEIKPNKGGILISQRSLWKRSDTTYTRVARAFLRRSQIPSQRPGGTCVCINKLKLYKKPRKYLNKLRKALYVRQLPSIKIWYINCSVHGTYVLQRGTRYGMKFLLDQTQVCHETAPCQWLTCQPISNYPAYCCM